MSNLSRNESIHYCHFRTPDYLYEMEEDVVTQSLRIRVYDIAMKRLAEVSTSIEALDILDLSAAMKNARLFFRRVAEKYPVMTPYTPPWNPEESELHVRRAIQQLEERMPVSTALELCCPLSLHPPRHPVVDNHGHLFDNPWIQNYVNKPCPISREIIQTLTPVLALRNALEEARKKPRIPTLIHFVSSNEELAEEHLRLAELSIEKGSYPDAEQEFAMAFQYTKNLEHYSKLLKLYERRDDQKFALTSLYLALYYLGDNQPDRACATLTHCREIVTQERLIDTALIKILTSLELINYQLYAEYANSAASPNEKVHFLLRGADGMSEIGEHSTARALIELARKHASRCHWVQFARHFDLLLGRRVLVRPHPLSLGRKEYLLLGHSLPKEAPLPPNIETELDKVCPFWGGKVRDTHHLVYSYGNLKASRLDARPDDLAISVRWPKEHRERLRPVWNSLKNASYPAGWYLITKRLIPGSTNSFLCTKKKLLHAHPGYELAPFQRVMAALLLENARTGKFSLIEKGDTYAMTACSQVVNNGNSEENIVVGVVEKRTPSGALERYLTFETGRNWPYGNQCGVMAMKRLNNEATTVVSEE